MYVYPPRTLRIKLKHEKNVLRLWASCSFFSHVDQVSFFSQAVHAVESQRCVVQKGVSSSLILCSLNFEHQRKEKHLCGRAPGAHAPASWLLKQNNNNPFLSRGASPLKSPMIFRLRHIAGRVSPYCHGTQDVHRTPRDSWEPQNGYYYPGDVYVGKYIRMLLHPS